MIDTMVKPWDQVQLLLKDGLLRKKSPSNNYGVLKTHDGLSNGVLQRKERKPSTQVYFNIYFYEVLYGTLKRHFLLILFPIS